MATIFGKKTVGLALGSGADRGYAHIGVIKALVKNNIPIDYLSGTSIGAVIASYYALTQNIDALEALATGINPATLMRLTDINNPLISAIKGEKIRHFLEEKLYQDKSFSDTKIPLRIGATSLEDGNCVIFKSGKIIDAVMASLSIPGFMPPVVYNEKHLIDGGLASAVPTELLEEFKPDLVVGVDLYRYGTYSKNDFSVRGVLDRTYKIYLSKLSDIQDKEKIKNCVIIKPVTNEGAETILFTHASQNIKIGFTETEKNLSKIKNLYQANFLSLLKNIFLK